MPHWPTSLCAQFVYLYEKHLILPTVRSEGYYLVLRESLQVWRSGYVSATLSLDTSAVPTHSTTHTLTRRLVGCLWTRVLYDLAIVPCLLQLLGDMLLQRHNYDNMMW